MSSNETTGKLSVKYQTAIVDEDGDLIASIHCTADGHMRTADARRLAACWNFCDGISTENLIDNIPLIDLVEKFNSAKARIAELEAQLEAVGAGGVQQMRGDVVTDEMVHAALREMNPALYGTHMRHPANGPALSAITENQISTVRKMLEAALGVQKS